MHIHLSIVFTTLIPLLSPSGTASASHVNAAPIDQHILGAGATVQNVSVPVFMELEELARLVDISYCVGVTGIRKPFECLSRCSDFPWFGLVDVRLCLSSSPNFELKDCSDMEHWSITVG